MFCSYFTKKNIHNIVNNTVYQSDIKTNSKREITHHQKMLLKGKPRQKLSADQQYGLLVNTLPEFNDVIS